MAGALVSSILEQLASILGQQVDEELKLVKGVHDKVQKLTSNFGAIRAVLDDAESRQVKDLAVRDWLDKLKDISYDIDDVLDEWKAFIGKLLMRKVENSSKNVRKVLPLIPCSCYFFRLVVLRHDVVLKIKDLNKTLNVIVMEKNTFDFSSTEDTIELKRPVTTSIIDDVSKFHGRDNEKYRLLMMLLNENSQAPTIPIISIVGMGGIGKTTLARLAFNDVKVNTHFEKKIWVCVSKPFDEIRIARAILESLVSDASKLDQLETILQEIRKCLIGKKFLLVLDDVWNEDPNDWEQLMGSLKCGSQESRILLTTRKHNVANIIGTTNLILLEILSEEESWSLFTQVAFSRRNIEEFEQLENIGRKIVSKCKGLPLAIKTLGSHLNFKKSIEECHSVLNSEMWELEAMERGLFPPLMLSYYDLPNLLKKCFSFCAIFPKNFEMKKDRLIDLWMAQNYIREERTKDMELIGEEYFENLAMRSFFQDFKKNEFDCSIESCKMHDVVHDFAQFLTKNECFSIRSDCLEECQVQSSSNNVRHLMVQLSTGNSFPMHSYNKQKNT